MVALCRAGALTHVILVASVPGAFSHFLQFFELLQCPYNIAPLSLNLGGANVTNMLKLPDLMDSPLPCLPPSFPFLSSPSLPPSCSLSLQFSLILFHT